MTWWLENQPKFPLRCERESEWSCDGLETCSGCNPRLCLFLDKKMNDFSLTLVSQESSLTGWHLVGDTGGRVWSVHRQTPPYLSVHHADVVNDLGSAYYWNAPGLYLGNKVRPRHTQCHTHSLHGFI